MMQDEELIAILREKVAEETSLLESKREEIAGLEEEIETLKKEAFELDAFHSYLTRWEERLQTELTATK